MAAILVLMMGLITGPAEKRAAFRKACADWLYTSEIPWPMADMKTHELLWLYGSEGLEPNDQAEIETELVHRIAYGLLNPEEQNRVIQALEEKDQDIL